MILNVENCIVIIVQRNGIKPGIFIGHGGSISGKTSDKMEGDILAGQEYHCPNCGGLMVTKDKETSTNCAFCGAPMILADRLSGKRRPAKLLPFQMDRQDAEKAFRKWCRNGRFSPRGFTSAENIQRLRGMYIPYWLFQFDTRVDISGPGHPGAGFSPGGLSDNRDRNL